ncbi:hypothetical protein RB195_002792 [Necator americanus]|uniref:G-protein coupled receptors family 1 profile domain-containing protein n=1 Tax=Necator americanus TaxID=51031 RepID=A0ABR1DKQ3_NECAM
MFHLPRRISLGPEDGLLGLKERKEEYGIGVMAERGLRAMLDGRSCYQLTASCRWRVAEVTCSRALSWRRILLLMLTFSGQFSASLNFIAAVMDFMNMDQMRVRNVLLIQRYTESMFFVANLATCIERSVAVLAVSSYEKYISRFISVSIVIAVVFTSSGAATFLIVFMDMYQDSTLKLVYYISYSLLYFLIALSVRVYRSCFRRETEVISLQDKFQHKENCRSAPIYTYIAISEVLATILIVAFVMLIDDGLRRRDFRLVGYAVRASEIVSANRLLCINFVIFYNCFLWMRHQRRAVVDNTDGDQYFHQLRNAWDGPKDVEKRQTYPRFLFCYRMITPK